MKKVFILVLVLVLAISMTGCKSDEEKYEDLINEAVKDNSFGRGDAKDKLTEAIALIPRKQDAYFALFDVYMKEFDTPDHVHDYYSHTLYDAERLLEDAENSLKYGSDSDSGFLDAYLKLYERYVKERDFAKAEEILSKAEGKVTNDYSAKKVEDTKNRLAYKIYFGEYEQDNDLSNGKEPIEWIVVSRNDSEMLLLSTCILDFTQFDEEKKKEEKKESSDGKWTPPEITSPGVHGNWDKSNLRKWLNDYFYNTAFSDSEKKMIISKTFVTERKNEKVTTEDNVFALTEEEMRLYPDVFEPYITGGMPFDVNIIQSTTEYALQKGAENAFFTRNGHSLCIRDKEKIDEDYSSSTSNKCGVRPALYIKLD